VADAASIIQSVGLSQCTATPRSVDCETAKGSVAPTALLCENHGPSFIARVTMHILWIVVVGFVAGIIARFLAPGPNNPSGFILTTLLGIAGAFLATWIGQKIGHYQLDQGAGFITSTIGAIVVLFIWHRLVSARKIPDPGTRRYL
jgi:uncharacterized membrane protein YeaQ/YmgE (transglycosylase-associated protein family)